jgi:predicted MFS family arabinose efflux permease
VTGGRGERLALLVLGVAIGTHLAAWPRSPAVQLAFLAELAAAVLVLALPRRRRPLTRAELRAAVDEHVRRKGGGDP